DTPSSFVLSTVAPGFSVANYSIDGRCEWFWPEKFVQCKECLTPNDKMARDCRSCGHTLIDPNKNLSGKHYTDADWVDVISAKRTVINSKKMGKGVLIKYTLNRSPIDGAKKEVIGGTEFEVAEEFLWPESRERLALAEHAKFVSRHIKPGFLKPIQKLNIRSAEALANNGAIDIPARITHRINEKGISVIHRKEFNSGRIAE
ncbi:MAG: hypothetical protein EBR90_04005, partial [Actinobacteria bacterium]|nr:hypothetical protein [Actinomycetota bacterium]